MLTLGRVSVNGRCCKLPKQPVKAGDEIAIGGASASATTLHGLQIIYEDEDLLVAEKPAGLLTVATEHERERTAFAYLSDDLRKRTPGQRLFIVHRLDKFVSGVLTFAKSEAAKEKLQALFRRHDIERRYWAIVEGQLARQRGTVRSFLAEDRSRRMHSTPGAPTGKLAVTHWRVLRKSANWTALEVTLETGRKNQIRAHMSEMGHPIVGDKAYGSAVDPFRRIALHAFRLGFVHPTRDKFLVFETEAPPEFRKYLPRD
jgi:23S rRNA pseudouridine1911/1915/1917 synthase